MTLNIYLNVNLSSKKIWKYWEHWKQTYVDTDALGEIRNVYTVNNHPRENVDSLSESKIY